MVGGAWIPGCGWEVSVVDHSGHRVGEPSEKTGAVMQGTHVHSLWPLGRAPRRPLGWQGGTQAGARSLARVSRWALESETAVSSTLRPRGQCLVFEVWHGGTGMKPSKSFLVSVALEALQGSERTGSAGPGSPTAPRNPALCGLVQAVGQEGGIQGVAVRRARRQRGSSLLQGAGC